MTFFFKCVNNACVKVNFFKTVMLVINHLLVNCTISVPHSFLFRRLHYMVIVLLSLFKNLFYNNVQPEICQNIKNMLRTDTRGSEKNI